MLQPLAEGGAKQEKLGAPGFLFPRLLNFWLACTLRSLNIRPG